MAWSQRKKLAWLILFPLAAVLAALLPFAIPVFIEFLSVETLEQWYPDGSLKLRYTVPRWGPLVNVPHGRWTEFYPGRGKRLEKYYQDGKLNGITTEWNMQGEIFAQYLYKVGRLTGVRLESPWFAGEGHVATDLNHGRFVEYDAPTGRKIREYSYAHGAPDGVWTTWDVDGTITTQRRYVGGKLVEERFSEPWFPGAASAQDTARK